MAHREYPTLSTDKRVRGAFLGLVAGDKNGGPTHMALELAESLLANRSYVPQNVLRRYLSWYHKGGFDTGRVTTMVFEKMKQYANSDAVMIVDVMLDGLTAGCNPLHRCLPIALTPDVQNTDLRSIAMAEARLTHRNPIAGEAVVAYLTIVRLIIESHQRPVELRRLILQASQHTSSFLSAYLFPSEHSEKISQSGYAPDVLDAALHFAIEGSNPQAALDAACNFAGPENCCPVIVGALIGALWGEDELKPHLMHCSNTLLFRAQGIANKLSARWAN